MKSLRDVYGAFDQQQRCKMSGQEESGSVVVSSLVDWPAGGANSDTDLSSERSIRIS